MSTVIGTSSYIAPEILNGSKYTQKCDVYSLGNIFYTILCGNAPYDEDDHDQ